jgi:hypothetical protein
MKTSYISCLIIFIVICYLIYLQKTKSRIENFGGKFSIHNLNKYWDNGIKNSNIGVVTQFTKEIYDYSKYSVKNLKYYCKKQQYKLYIFNEHLCKQVHPCWYKIILIIHLLSKHKYLVWIDSDAIITNPEIRFDKFITGTYDMYVCEDISPTRTSFNSGVMIFHNNDITKKFLNSVWNYDGPHGYTPDGDQDILNMMYKKKGPIKIKIYNMNAFNSHPRKFEKNDFILHLMVRDRNKRIQIMREFNKLLNISNDNITINCIRNKKCLGEHKINCQCKICKSL